MSIACSPSTRKATPRRRCRSPRSDAQLYKAADAALESAHSSQPASFHHLHSVPPPPNSTVAMAFKVIDAGPFDRKVARDVVRSGEMGKGVRRDALGKRPAVLQPVMFVVLAALVAVANAGYLGGYAGYAAPAAVGYAAPAYGHALATPAITAQASNILRTPGNLGQVSTYSKAIDTPYSSVRKSDVRVSNDALAYGAVAAPAYGYARAAYGGAYAAPALAAPALGYARAAYGGAYAAPVARAGLLGVAYSAAPAVAHVSYTGLGAAYGW
ncbi:Pupal cuticle protein C1B [Gryllus bimaculatus]|nr:Pupal cuticle protein C1B [Gryllus bimaculatus]